MIALPVHRFMTADLHVARDCFKTTADQDDQTTVDLSISNDCGCTQWQVALLMWHQAYRHFIAFINHK